MGQESQEEGTLGSQGGKGCTDGNSGRSGREEGVTQALSMAPRMCAGPTHVSCLSRV